MDAFGFTKGKALEYIKKASEETKLAIIKGFKQDAKKNFYEGVSPANPFLKKALDENIAKKLWYEGLGLDESEDDLVYEEKYSFEDDDSDLELDDEEDEKYEEDDEEISYSFVVYELDEEGDEIDSLEGFATLEEAIAFAEKQSCQTHIVYVPDADPDDFGYPDTPDEYGAFEIVWSSEDEIIEKNESDLSEEIKMRNPHDRRKFVIVPEKIEKAMESPKYKEWYDICLKYYNHRGVEKHYDPTTQEFKRHFTFDSSQGYYPDEEFLTKFFSEFGVKELSDIRHPEYGYGHSEFEVHTDIDGVDVFVSASNGFRIYSLHAQIDPDKKRV